MSNDIKWHVVTRVNDNISERPRAFLSNQTLELNFQAVRLIPDLSLQITKCLNPAETDAQKKEYGQCYKYCHAKLLRAKIGEKTVYGLSFMEYETKDTVGIRRSFLDGTVDVVSAIEIDDVEMLRRTFASLAGENYQFDVVKDPDNEAVLVLVP